MSQTKHNKLVLEDNFADSVINELKRYYNFYDYVNNLGKSPLKLVK